MPAYIIAMPAIVLVTTAVLPFVSELIIISAIIITSKNRWFLKTDKYLLNISL